MIEYQYENENKLYVSVLAEFSPEGVLLPRRIGWADGRAYPVERVLDVRPAASTRAGGIGIRYTCRIAGKTVFLFLENDKRWFMEK